MVVVVPSPQLTTHIVKESVLISIYLNIFRLMDTPTKVLLKLPGKAASLHWLHSHGYVNMMIKLGSVI